MRETHLVDEAAQAERDEAFGADLVVLALDGGHDELKDESVDHRVVLQCL